MVRNFTELKTKDSIREFDIYFDTTDLFLREAAKQNDFSFTHVSNSDIPLKFGDYANIVIVTSVGEVRELKTNESLKKGKHYLM